MKNIYLIKNRLKIEIDIIYETILEDDERTNIFLDNLFIFPLYFSNFYETNFHGF